MPVLLQSWSTTSGSINAMTHLERFAVFSDIFARRAVLIPHKFASLEVFRLRSSRHPASRKFMTKESISMYRELNHWLILFVGDLRAREGSKDLLHHSEMLPEMRNSHSCHVAINLKSYSYSYSLFFILAIWFISQPFFFLQYYYRLSWVWKRVKPR